jgi:hypothetical protein
MKSREMHKSSRGMVLDLPATLTSLHKPATSSSWNMYRYRWHPDRSTCLGAVIQLGRVGLSTRGAGKAESSRDDGFGWLGWRQFRSTLLVLSTPDSGLACSLQVDARGVEGGRAVRSSFAKLPPQPAAAVVSQWSMFFVPWFLCPVAWTNRTNSTLVLLVPVV